MAIFTRHSWADATPTAILIGISARIAAVAARLFAIPCWVITLASTADRLSGCYGLYFHQFSLVQWVLLGESDGLVLEACRY